MKIIIYRNREVYKENSKIGNDSENKVETLDFEFPEEFKEFNKYIEFQIKGEKCVDLIQNNQYVITRNVARYGKIKTQIVLKKIVDNDTIVFKSNIFTVNVSASINASEEIEQTLHVDVIQTLSQNISKIGNEISSLEKNKANKEEIPVVPSWAKQDNKPQYTASEIAFEDGETFQKKYNEGELKGTDGKDGVNGKSAYEIAVEKGFQGTVEEWLISLKGQDGTNGIDGIDGKSAYQIWLDKGNTGTEEEFLNSLKGKDGVYDDTKIKQDILEIQEEQTQQNTKIEENSTELETLKSECKRLKQENTDLKNTLPSGQASGENLTLEDSADMAFKKLRIGGNTWQETREGYNFLNYNDVVSKEINGITFTINKDKSITANGTATANATLNLIGAGSNYPLSLEAGDYVLSGCTGGSKDSYILEIYNGTVYKSSQNGATQINFAEDTSIRAYITVKAGITVSNVTFYPMLTKGTAIKKYEQNGAMPSNEFSSQIRSCGDNANKFDKESFVEFYNLTTGKDGEREYIAYTTNSSGSNVFMQNQFKENTQYTISFYGRQASKNAQGKTSGIKFVYTDGTKSEIYLNNDENWTKYKLTSEAGKTIEGISLLWAYGGTIWMDEVKIEEGTVATPHSQFGEGNVNFTICNKNLVSNNFSDWIDSETAGYKYLPLQLKKGKYKLWGELIGTKDTNFNFGIAKNGISYTDFSKSILFLVNYGEGAMKNGFDVIVDDTYTSPKLVCYCPNGEEHFNEIFKNYKFQFEEQTKTNYVEHKEQNYIFPLKQKLHTGDYLAEDGIHHKRKEIVLDGVSDGLRVYAINQYTNGLYYCTLNAFIPSINGSFIYSSHFKSKGTVEKGNCYITGNGTITVLVLEDQTITTVEQANNWLAQQKANGTPVTIQYELAEEKLEKYNEEQKRIYNEIMQTARSYKEKTHIFSTDEISPKFDVEYIKDTSILLNNLSKSIVGGN